MKGKNESKEIHIKNRTLYYFDDIINGTSINFNILFDKKSYENISVYNILYKTPTGPKPLRIRFDKIDLLYPLNELAFLNLELISLLFVKPSFSYFYLRNYFNFKFALDIVFSSTINE